MRGRLDRSFFARDADRVARDLLGHVLVHRTPAGRAAVRIVETEAYFGPPGANPTLARRRAAHLAPLRSGGDPASHSFRGRTARNRAMWGEPGRAYVYLIYGAHECLNVVTGPADDPQAVLLRAGEPVDGLAAMRARRPGAKDAHLARGPGNLARALGVTRAHYGADLVDGSLRFEPGTPPRRVRATPRVNVVGAEEAPLRFVYVGSASVSGPAHLNRKGPTRVMLRG